MMKNKSFIEVSNGDDKYILDMKRDKVYEIYGNTAIKIKPSVEQFTRFNPYIEEIRQYDKIPYAIT